LIKTGGIAYNNKEEEERMLMYWNYVKNLSYDEKFSGGCTSVNFFLHYGDREKSMNIINKQEWVYVEF